MTAWIQMIIAGVLGGVVPAVVVVVSTRNQVSYLSKTFAEFKEEFKKRFEKTEDGTNVKINAAFRRVDEVKDKIYLLDKDVHENFARREELKDIQRDFERCRRTHNGTIEKGV